MARALTDYGVTRLSKGEIEAMSASDIKSTLKGMGVKGVTAKRDDLVRVLSEYNGSGTAEGLLRELPTKSKEWLSRFSNDKT